MRKSHTPFHNRFLIIIFSVSLLFVNVFFAFGVETITELLKTNKSENFKLGGSAYLTSGVNDPAGNGWLRLTKDTTWQTGYAILNKSFPSKLGILIDLELMIWRKETSLALGADGISVFLFDAKTPIFNIGAFGGSLGYAQYSSSTVTKPGVSNGYLGVGIDEFGNYSNPNDGRNGGPGFKANSIGLRGSASSNYAWLTGNSKLPFTLQLGAFASRPNDDPSYRRLQIEVSPTKSGATNTYSVTARMKTSKTGAFITIFEPYTLTYATPDSLRLGLAASTGNNHNFHDVRNVMISTSSGVRLENKVNKIEAAVGDTLTYTLDIFNQTPGMANGLTLSDIFNYPSILQIESVEFDNQSYINNTATNFGKTQLSNINLNLSAYSNCQFVIKAIVKDNPTGGSLTSTATLGLGSSNVIDPDITNNTGIVSTVIIRSNKEISLVKSVLNTKEFQLGDEIQYSFKVENTGVISLKNVKVIDNKLLSTPVYISGDLNQNKIIESGESWLYTGNYTVLQSDIDLGEVVNRAVVTSQDQFDVIVSDTSGITIKDNIPTVTTLIQQSKVTLVKTVLSAGNYRTGSTIRYGFTIKNNGNTVLSDVSISDLKLLTPPDYQSGDLNGNNKLDRGESWFYIAEYTVKIAEVIAGNVSNTAIVTAKDPKGSIVTDISGTTELNDNQTVILIDQTGKISLTKSISNSGPFKTIGDEIRYIFTVKNEGNIKLKNLVITDAKLSNQITYISGDLNNNTELDLTEIWLYSAKYLVNQADLDLGFVSNIAEVTALDPALNSIKDISGPTAFEDNPTITKLLQTPKIAIVKSVSNSGTFFLGDLIKYDFTVANIGNVTLAVDSLKDTKLISQKATYLNGDKNANSFLDVDEIWNYSGTHLINQADVDSGRVVNSATIYAKDPQKNELFDTSGSTTLNDNPTVTMVSQTGAITLVKKVISTGPYILGDTIKYALTVTNYGTITLSDIVLTDDKITGEIIKTKIDANGKLDVEETWEYTGSYKVTQTDVDAGFVSSSATVTAKGPLGTILSDISGSSINTNNPTVVIITQYGRVSLIKSIINNGPFRRSDEIVYGFTTINTGNVTLSEPALLDPKLNFTPEYKSGDLNANKKIDVGESWNYEGLYLVTASDVYNEKITNTAYLTCFEPKGNMLTDISGITVSDDLPVITAVEQSPLMANDLSTTKKDIEVNIPVLDNDKPASSAFDPTSIQIIEQAKNGTLIANENGTVTYIPNDNYVGIDFFTYSVKDLDGYTSAATRVDITVVDNKLVIPNVFTPNADGWNDKFKILGLDSYKKAELIIFNRWGNEVYRSNNYANDWEGLGLNEGTYYYVLKLDKRENQSVQKGWLLLKRE